VVPEDIATPQFMTTMIRNVLEVTPVAHHVAVRELIERRHIPVEEQDARELAETTAPQDAPLRDG
jgi:hypothetical protein